MRKVNYAATVALFAVGMIGRLTLAQDAPALSVVPSKATILVARPTLSAP
jgi:hypothetical protein